MIKIMDIFSLLLIYFSYTKRVYLSSIELFFLFSSSDSIPGVYPTEKENMGREREITFPLG